MQLIVNLQTVRKAERAARSAVIAEEESGWQYLLQGFRQSLHNRRVPPSVEHLIPPATNALLYPHQRDGVAFLYAMHLEASGGSGGCLLADDMGLGKTVQVCAFLNIAMNHLRTSKVLVAGPTSVLEAWKTTLCSAFGGLQPEQVVSYTGTPDKRRKLFDRFRRASSATVLLATVGVIVSDIEFLVQYRFDYAILDEAQVIRNPTTAAHICFGRLVALRRIALTGTPVMNSIVDLWGILSFANPAALGLTRQECVALSSAVNRGNERDASFVERQQAALRLRRVMEGIRHLVLRRTKSDVNLQQRAVAGTPTCPATVVVPGRKHEVVLWLRPSNEQLHLYTTFLRSDDVAAALSSTRQARALVLLVNLKKICDHPWLNLTRPNLERVMHPSFCCSAAAQELAPFGTALSSPKITVAIYLCRTHAQQGHKTVVFSQSKVLLQIIAVALAHIAPELRLLTLSGEVPADERHRRIAAFNADPTIAVLCVTTGVGGVGVSLTAATRLIVMDPSWNPAVDAQAIDRVHRIGQSKEVIAFRLVTCGTVEERIYRRQITKILLSQQVMQQDSEGPPAGLAYFTRGQLRDLFAFDVSATQQSQTAQLLFRLHGHTVPSEILQYVLRCESVTDVSDHTALTSQNTLNSDAIRAFLAEDVAELPVRDRVKPQRPQAACSRSEVDAFAAWAYECLQPRTLVAAPSPPPLGRAGQSRRPTMDPAVWATAVELPCRVLEANSLPRHSGRFSTRCWGRRTLALFQDVDSDAEFEAEGVAEAQRAFGADLVADEADSDDSLFDENRWRDDPDAPEPRVWPCPRDSLRPHGDPHHQMMLLDALTRESLAVEDYSSSKGITVDEYPVRGAGGSELLSLPLSPVATRTSAYANRITHRCDEDDY